MLRAFGRFAFDVVYFWMLCFKYCARLAVPHLMLYVSDCCALSAVRTSMVAFSFARVRMLRINCCDACMDVVRQMLRVFECCALGFLRV